MKAISTNTGNTWMPPRRAGILLACAMWACTSLAQAQDRHGQAQEVREVENKGSDVSSGNTTAKSVGSMAGVFGGMLGGSKLNNKLGGHGTAVGMLAGEYLGSEVAGKIVGVGPSKRYMLKIQFDDGSKLALAKPSNEGAGLQKGGRVVVAGSGSKAKISAVSSA